MKNINTRGFVMVETIIVAVAVIGICTFLFANFLPLIADYERIENYDTLESKYKLNEIRKMILREAEYTQVFTSIDENVGYIKYESYEETVGSTKIKKNRLCDLIISKNYCNKLLSNSFLDVQEIYITKFKLSEMKNSIKNLSGARALKEYIDYLPSYSKYSSRYDDYYRLIVLFNNGEFANIEVRYENW